MLKNYPQLTIQYPNNVKFPALVERIENSMNGKVGEQYIVVSYNYLTGCFITKDDFSHSVKYLKLLEEGYYNPREIMIDLEKVL